MSHAEKRWRPGQEGGGLQSPELRALLTQMEQERQVFDARVQALRDNIIEVQIAARNVMQCARAVAVMADGGLSREGGALQ